MQSEELQSIVEEYTFIIQELKIQKTDLQEQLLQTSEDMAISSQDSVNKLTSDRSVQSVVEEIAELHEDNDNSELLPPLCGILQTANSHVVPLIMDAEMTLDDDIWFETELTLVRIKCETDGLLNLLQEVAPPDSPEFLEECHDALQQTYSCLTQLKCAWEQLSSKLYGTVNMQREREKFLHKYHLSSLYAWFTKIQKCRIGQVWIQSRSWRKMMVILLMGSCLFQPVQQRDSIWTLVQGLLSDHVQLQYLEPPLF
ncbi:uncharacterized protein LOC134577491 [Pelobates fuscus]|uniref:uncharacterized protein LOC134577491 n=1 Tax=Pelobates fuscus TaxID=191477 RepID=UPI002FE474FA